MSTPAADDASSTVPVFAWVASDWSLSSAPPTLPAVRVWADVVLSMVATRFAIQTSPSVAIRKDAVFGWPTPTPPQSLAHATAGRTRVELLVRPNDCATADVFAADGLYSPVAWRGLREWLVDRGHDPNLVGEEITPVLDPTAGMAPERGHIAVTSTPEPLLRAVIDYFEPAARRYLETWNALTAYALGPTTEVIIPRSGIVGVVGSR